MKNAHHFAANDLSSKFQRALDAFRALRNDAALAHRASATAQLSRRSPAELRALYLAPGHAPENAPSTATPKPGRANRRGHWLDHRGVTAITVCALLVVVVAIVMPHSG